YRLAFPKLLERVIPELQVQDVALAGEQVIVNVDPRHGAQVAPHDRHRDEFRQAGRVVVAFLYFLKRRTAKRVLWILGFVERRHPCVDIPAVVIEFDRWVRDDPPDLFQCFSFDVFEADNDVRNLYTGIVDVVLNFDGASYGLQYPDERVADCRISQVSDM